MCSFAPASYGVVVKIHSKIMKDINKRIRDTMVRYKII